MQIIAPSVRSPQLVSDLLHIWERSVIATHTFLPQEEIAAIKKEVPEAIRKIESLIILRETQPLGFMGICGHKVEMLFLDPLITGRGHGRALLMHGIEHYDIYEITVNEHNHAARGFYEHLGFRMYKRTPLDESGRPWPLLYMHLPDREGMPD